MGLLPNDNKTFVQLRHKEDWGADEQQGNVHGYHGEIIGYLKAIIGISKVGLLSLVQRLDTGVPACGQYS